MRSKRSGQLIAVVLAMCMILGSGPMAILAQAGSDIEGHWAEQVINRWVDRKIVDGYPDGTFRPSALIKRAEFAALINRTFGFATLSAVEFSDVSGDQWFATDVSKAVGAGYMDGYPDGTFKPNANISRQEAAIVLARILGFEKTDKTFGFTDIETIPAWSLWAVVAVANAGIMTGYPDGSFGPTGNFTRAETVTVLDRLVAEVFTEEGTYGDVDEQTVIEGNVVVLAENVKLCNYHITGDLLIAESVGEGAVTLDRVIVDGELTVKGGGADSVVIKNSTVVTLIVDKEGVRIVIQDGTRVSEAYVRTPSRVEQDADGKGIEALTIEEIFGEGEVTLSGDFPKVSIRAESGRIVVDGGHIDRIIVESDAADVVVELGSNASVTNLVLDAPVTVEGTGNIEAATVNASGAVIEQQPGEVVLPEGVSANIGGKDVVGSAPVVTPGGSSTPSKVSVSAISVEGVAKVGETLSAAGLQPENATVKYQWQYSVDGDTDWKDISGENSETYVIDVEYVGKHIRLEVKGTGSYTGTKTSNVVGPVTYSNEAINEALGKVNAITGTAADVKVINDNADILGLDLTAFEALDKVTGQEGGRQTAVMKDLASNKPDEGYDQETLKAIFDSIVAVRTATQASMDLVNEAESLENIDYVEDLLAAFEGVAQGHTIHSGKAISEKVTALEKLVSDFEALPEANQAAALTAVIDNKPKDGYLRSQSTLDALANAIAEQESEIEEAINEALGKVNAITGTAADVKVINDNADILGLDLTAFEALDKVTGQEGGRQTAVMKDLASNKPDEGYDQETLKAIFDSIVAVRTATQASMDLVNEAESLENIDYVEDLLAAFEGVAQGHTIHSGKAISEKVTALEKLVSDFEALPEANQAAALTAVIDNKPKDGYLRSQSTLDALANAIAEQESEIEEAINEALGKVNAITGTAADVKVINDNADILGLDLTAFEALDKVTGQEGGRQTAVMKDLASNKPDEGYDQETLKAIFDSIVAVRTATQASMDLVNEAESLENIDYVEDLLAAFEGVAQGHTIHSGKAISEKVTALEKLVSDFEALPEANQAAALTAVIDNKPKDGYLRSQSTLDALANAIAEQESEIEEAINEALGKVNAITGTAADVKVINDNADILGLDLTAFEALDKVTGQEGGRQTAVMKDLASNKPDEGYDQETLKAIFDSIVAVRTATQASMDLVNEAESLENIDYVEDLLAAFEGVAQGHTIHSGKAISEKVTALEKLVSDFEALPEANQAAALTAVIDNKPKDGYLRSQSTLDALANAIAEQESEIEEAINEALGKVNAITGTAADVKVINDNADILGLDLTAFEALDKVTGQEGGRQTAVMKDLASNKPDEGYDQETLKAIFDSIVAVRTATQASMDLVNEAESLENIDYVEDLLAAFEGVAQGHTIHSGKAISEKVTALEKLVSDFEALPEANQAAALTAVIDNKPKDGYLRSQSTLDALANAIAEQESEIEEAINEALGKVNAITGTAADVKVINDNADILGLDLTAFEALDKVTGQEGGRQTAVMKDLASNKPDEGYDQETLKAIFDSIVAVRTATQASMDLVNEAESLENIDYVEDLLAAFEGVAQGHTIHSGKAISEKVTALEKLVSDFEALPEANQAAALTAVIDNKPKDGYLRSQSTLDALANAIAEQKGIIEGAVAG